MLQKGKVRLRWASLSGNRSYCFFLCSFVHLFFCPSVGGTLQQSFALKFLRCLYLYKHSLEIFLIWNIGTLEGWLSCHDSWPPCLSCHANNLWRYLVKLQLTLWHWPVCHEVKVSITCISRSSDFALYFEYYLSLLRRLWYLSHRWPAKAQASLHIRAVSPKPSLFAHMKYGSRRKYPTKNQTSTYSPTGWLHMRIWRMSLWRTKSTIISWDGSFDRLMSNLWIM